MSNPVAHQIGIIIGSNLSAEARAKSLFELYVNITKQIDQEAFVLYLIGHALIAYGRIEATAINDVQALAR